MSRRMVKVAVVGSGLAGLTAAYLLSQTKTDEPANIEVHLFEKESRLGMDSSSVTLGASGEHAGWRVDVPMRSFQGGYYPRLISMYKHLGVRFRQADFTYSFSLLTPAAPARGQQITTTMIYNGSSGREGISMPSALRGAWLAAEGEPWFARALAWVATYAAFALMAACMAFSYVRLLWLTLPVMRSRHLAKMTFREWSEGTVPDGLVARVVGLDGVWREFTRTVLLPLLSAVCTASEEDIMGHPVEEFLDYIWLTMGTHHYVVEKGVRDVVARLTSNLSPSCVHLSSPLSGIRRCDEGLTVECGTTSYHGFSHVVLATQANNAVPMLSSYLLTLPDGDSSQRFMVEDQIRCLRAFQYRSNVVVNHTDSALLPDVARDRRDLNLIRLAPPSPPSSANVSDTDSDADRDSVRRKEPAAPCVPSTFTMATQILPRPASHCALFPDVYQTTNPIVPPRKGTILSIARLERAVLTVRSKEALRGLCTGAPQRWWHLGSWAGGGDADLGPLQGAGAGKGIPGIWICGSYAHVGIPLLEGCVVSARNVVKGLLASEGMEASGAGWTW